MNFCNFNQHLYLRRISNPATNANTLTLASNTMKTVKTFFILTVLTLLCSQCGMDKFKEQANKQFGDQHFKTAIALIELHKIRFGEYPATLDSIKYIGDWDKIIWTS